MKQPVGQSGRNSSNCSHIIHAQRATCHQVAQLRSKGTCVHPFLGKSVPFGKPRHANIPFVEAFYL
jgi:hypothetical protein